MPISDIVTVTISRETQSVSKKGFGIPMILGESDKLPTKDVVVVTFDADLVANDTTTVTLNGTALSDVLFSVDNDTTLQLIADVIQSVANVETAVISGTAPNQHIITVTGKVDLSVTVNSAVVVNTVPGPEAEATISRTASARIRFYASLVEVAVDFAETDPEYIAAGECFAQLITPSSIAIGRKNSATLDVVTITLDSTLVAGDVFGADINGVALAGAGLTFAATEAATMAAIAAVIELLASVTTCTATDVGAVGFVNTLTITGVAATDIVVTDEAITGGVTILVVARIDGESYTQALNKIVQESDDWYALAIESRTDTDILLVAAWIETQVKLFALASSDTDILGTGTVDIAGQLKALNYDRAVYSFRGDAATKFFEFGWYGKMLPTDPGSATWMFKTIIGEVASVLTSAERTNALAKNCNIYHSSGGVDITEEGKVASGEYIDIIRGLDWLQMRMMEKIFGHLVNRPKIPFTDAGIAGVEADVRAILDLGIAKGLVAETPAYTVTVPSASAVSIANKIARNLPDVTFQATLAGAIHHVTISGIVTV